ncbi:type II toxin-antitoxin system Phd/YefM family antitoxin [Mucilaginibacter sp. CAU 1740]|uniref:type II toxin-antitoxin system Phd/YefM family antitoxin n=1 Tax=Mucilaginibacter sp. CAU 1740 TaxID=3140365 RepID=UPI00325B87BC
MIALTIARLRNKMEHYFNQVSNSNDIIVVPGEGEEDAGVVIISIKEYNSLIETEHLLSNEINRKWLAESIDQLHQGNTIRYAFE